MTWNKQDLGTPIPDELQSALAPVSSLIGSITPLLSTISSFLDIAKIFVTTIPDPFSALAGPAISSLSDFNNDLFGTGFFNLNVTPFSFEVSPAQAQVISQTFNSEVTTARTELDREIIRARLGSSTYKELVNRIRTAYTNYNNAVIAARTKADIGQSFDEITGFPLLSPGEAILAAIESFDDLADPNRPQFSSSANVTAFGLMITAPSLEEFSSVLQSISNVFSIPAWNLTLRRASRAEVVAPTVSVNPDWRSIRFNSIEGLAEIQRQVDRLLETVRGYLVVPDENIADLIDIIQRKVDELNEALQSLNDIINSITNISGVYVLNIPPGIGGNERIKTALRDPVLEDPCLKSNFTVLSLFVGGGPSLAVVDSIRRIIV